MGLNPRFLPEDPDELDALEFEEASHHGVRKFRDDEVRGSRQRRKPIRHKERHREPDFEDD
ncbi:MAG: hypothetical protein AMJ59_03175 [Gammaproteobacteria bacterium SG8_31]|jgi:hypothetical protein|nr:MAG: hypothetical protein AMJ59_03175 [Gammaproteobacteria bacterium SG8_31]